MHVFLSAIHDRLPLNLEGRIFGRNEGFYSITFHFVCHAGKKSIHQLTVLAITVIPGFVRGRPGCPVPGPDFRGDREEKRDDGLGIRHPLSGRPPLHADDLIFPESFKQGIVGTRDPDQGSIQDRDDDLFAWEKNGIFF